MAAIPIIDTPLFEDEELKGYWQFEDNSNDSKDSHNGSDTSISYSETHAKFGKGAVGTAGNSCITLAQSNDFKPTTSYSIAGWVYLATIDDYNDIFSNYGAQDATNRGTNFGVRLANKLQAIHYDDAWDVVYGNTTLEAGVLYHVGLTWDGSNARFYLNGQADGAPALTRVPSYQESVSTPCIGGYNSSGTPVKLMSGTYDDLGYWNGKVLSADDMSNLYTGNWPATTEILKIAGVTYATTKKVSGIAIAEVKKIAGLA